MSKKNDKSLITISEYVSFDLAYLESVQRVAMALIQSGYYAKITRNDNGITYTVKIYTDRNTSTK